MSVPADVVALGAWCDLREPDAWQDPHTISFVVHEFAVLSDGRRVTLHTDRGFSGSVRTTDGQVLDPWTGLTRESIEHDVRNVVLPDEDDTGDEHPYEWLRELLLHHGVDAPVEHLRSAPYTVELSDRLERLLYAHPDRSDGTA